MTQLTTPSSPANTITEYVRFTELSLAILATHCKWICEPSRVTRMLQCVDENNANISYWEIWNI